MVNLKALLTIHFLIFSIAGLKAQDSVKHSRRFIKSWDTTTQWRYRLNAGICGFELSQTSYVPFQGYYYDFISNNSGFSRVFHNTSGIVFSNAMIRDYSDNPVSPVADFSVRAGSFRMNIYDSAYKEITHTRFTDFYMLDLGLGAEIDGKIFMTGVAYRFGYVGGGKINSDIPIDPEVIQNRKINLNSYYYHGLEVLLGGHYKNFNLRFRGTFPFNQYLVALDNKWPCSLSQRSIEFGYTW